MNISRFRGHGAPLTERGMASPYGPHPWHMAGRNLTIWFRASADEIARHVPEPLTVPPDAFCRVRFYELVHNGGFDDNFSARDASRGVFREAVLAVPAAFEADVGEYGVHLYSDDPDYMCWARETIGWPVKMGSISISRPWPTRPLEPGTQVQAILERCGRRLITASVTLTEPLPPDAQPHAARPQYAVKIIPSAEHGQVSVRQIVAVHPSPPSMPDVWRAEAMLAFGESFSDELHFFAPFEIVQAEYVPSLDLTMPYGRILATL